jgi:ubiquinone/menaquinone biosynthesis C-methylase UbiE
MTQDQKGHKWFAAFWDWMVRHESSLARKGREEIVGGANGRVLEIGCGTGASFPYYRDAASELIATDPDPYMLERARKRAAKVGRPIEIQLAPAEELPFEDESFDTVVSIWVMCHARDPAKALSEVKRVLRPEGEFRFFEHVRYDHDFGAFWQDLITPVWKRLLASGCHPNRDTARSIREAGFVIQQLDSLKLKSIIADPTRPSIRGVARPS